jgi:heme exporter protein CcmD
MSGWFTLDGHAGFVWSAYAVTALALGGLVLHTLVRWRRAARRSEALDTRRRGRRGGAT